MLPLVEPGGIRGALGEPVLSSRGVHDGQPTRRYARSAGSAPEGAIPLRGFAPAARASSPLGDFARRER